MCDERDRLIDYVYNECGPDERQVVEAHLESCETCRDEIRGLRETREDLLAWDVPDRGSVWKPFAPPRVAPSWRDVPRWALAAAASVMFLIGAAGGFATRAFLPAATAGTAVVQAASAADSTADPKLAAQQIRDLIRTELDQRAVPVSTSATAVPVASHLSDDELIRRVQQMIATSELRQGQQLESRVQGVRQASLAAVLNDYYGLDYRTKRSIQQLADRISRQDELIRQLTLASQPAGK